jgi:hypothetical protein
MQNDAPWWWGTFALLFSSHFLCFLDGFKHAEKEKITAQFVALFLFLVAFYPRARQRVNSNPTTTVAFWLFYSKIDMETRLPSSPSVVRSFVLYVVCGEKTMTAVLVEFSTAQYSTVHVLPTPTYCPPDDSSQWLQADSPNTVQLPLPLRNYCTLLIQQYPFLSTVLYYCIIILYCTSYGWFLTPTPTQHTVQYLYQPTAPQPAVSSVVAGGILVEYVCLFCVCVCVCFFTCIV